MGSNGQENDLLRAADADRQENVRLLIALGERMEIVKDDLANLPGTARFPWRYKAPYMPAKP
jgi:hypothetical protein